MKEGSGPPTERDQVYPLTRLAYYPGYYATWVLDPDGHDIEVVNKI